MRCASSSPCRSPAATPIQYTIAAWLLGLGVVLWALTWLANRFFFGKKTYLRDPEELASEDSTLN